MKKILVAYATMAGSTAEVAQVVGDELARTGWQVDVLPLSKVNDLEDYAGVVVGAPMIMGWHRDAQRFLKRHRDDFQHIPLAAFVMAISLTQSDRKGLGNVLVVVDERLPKAPARAGSLSFKERYASLENYLKPVLKAARPAKPVSIGVFGGRLEYGRLKWWAVLFVMLIIQAQAGDRRNWDAIRQWASSLPAAFQIDSSSSIETD